MLQMGLMELGLLPLLLIIISSFQVIAEGGAAKTYTSLALETNSCHFRCLRDAIDSEVTHAERVYRELSTILEGEAYLDYASVLVQISVTLYIL
ncbi:putative POX domain-containing protein [Helianthus anomalus]